MEKIIENIKKIRKAKGYSHEYLAHELNLSQVAYSKLEKNETKLTVERLFRIGEILEVEVCELLGVNNSNQFNQTNNENATGYLQQIDHFTKKIKNRI